MLPADGHSMPVFPPSPSFGRRSVRMRIAAFVGKLLRHLGRADRTVIPGLPEDLLADLAIDSQMKGRVDDFWQAKRRSIGRDLPL